MTCGEQLRGLGDSLKLLRQRGGDLWAVSIDPPSVIAHQHRQRPDLEMTFASADRDALSGIGLLYETKDKTLAVPSSILIDASGRVRWTHYAARNGDRPAATEIIRQLRLLSQTA